MTGNWNVAAKLLIVSSEIKFYPCIFNNLRNRKVSEKLYLLPFSTKLYLDSIAIAFHLSSNGLCEPVRFNRANPGQSFWVQYNGTF